MRSGEDDSAFSVHVDSGDTDSSFEGSSESGESGDNSQSESGDVPDNDNFSSYIDDDYQQTYVNPDVRDGKYTLKGHTPDDSVMINDIITGGDGTYLFPEDIRHMIALEYGYDAGDCPYYIAEYIMYSMDMFDNGFYDTLDDKGKLSLAFLYDAGLISSDSISAKGWNLEEIQSLAAGL